MNTADLTKQIEEVLALAAKATPGRWIADDFCENDGEVRRLGTSDGTRTYYLSSATLAYFHTNLEDEKDPGQPFVSEPRRKFNCQLSAAAPDMADLLRQVLPMIKDAERYQHVLKTPTLQGSKNGYRTYEAAVDASMQQEPQTP